MKWFILELRGLFRSYNLSTGKGMGIYLSATSGLLGCQYQELLIVQPAMPAWGPIRGQRKFDYFLDPFFPSCHCPFSQLRWVLQQWQGKSELGSLLSSKPQEYSLSLLSLHPSLRMDPKDSLQKCNTLYFGSTDHVHACMLGTKCFPIFNSHQLHEIDRIIVPIL